MRSCWAVPRSRCSSPKPIRRCRPSIRRAHLRARPCERRPGILGGLGRDAAAARSEASIAAGMSATSYHVRGNRRQRSAPKGGAMSSENKALLRRWFEEVWNRGRVEAIDEMLSSDAVIHGLGADAHGPDGFKQFHAAYRSAFPDVTLRIDEIVAEGNIVALRW